VAYTTAQLIANYILVATGTATGGGYLAPQVHSQAPAAHATTACCGFISGALLYRPYTAMTSPHNHTLQGVLLAIYGAVLVTQGLINIVARNGLDSLYSFSVWFHAVFVTVFVVVLPSVVPVRQSAEYVFTSFVPANEAGITSSGFLFLMGLLGSQWAMVGAELADKQLLLQLAAGRCWGLADREQVA
jgi:hypothetical protein